MRARVIVTIGCLIAAALTASAPGGRALAALPRCHGVTATIVVAAPGLTTDGTGDPDVIVGTAGDDTINGMGDDDLICGGGGADTIDGGAGNDTVYGGNGDDVLKENGIFGDDGDDTYFGEAGADKISDLLGANVAHGGPGSDSIVLWGKVYGDAGNDPVLQATESCTGCHDAYADGGSGSDGQGGSGNGIIINGGTAKGGSGDDVIFLVADGDVAYGGSGSDFLSGSIGSNQLLDCGSAYDSYASDGTDTVRRCEAVSVPFP
jgi:Ca2+-binding RTX toxin-like protein